ncbi:MAG: D-3-phosphoglycerate dehydrogenase [Bradyrhizobium sp.]|jgi:D-3-phosphoglycerate dehydrogenase
MKIAILDDYQDRVRHLDCFKLLAGHDVRIFNHSARGLGQLAIRLASFDALVLIHERTSMPAALLNKLPRLKLIVQTGSVSGHIDLVAAAKNGITIVEGSNDPTAPAELTWALIMASMRRIPDYTSNLRDGLWQTVSTAPEKNLLGRVLSGQTLGIWGYGKVGRLVAGFGKAFGMSVLVWGSCVSRASAFDAGFEVATSKRELFARADVLSLHLRLGGTTLGCVTFADLAAMKSSALLVNTSHAELLVTGALQQALVAGCIGYVALDVFDAEPLPVTSPLLQYSNVLASPHLGFVEEHSYELLFSMAFQNIVDFFAGVPRNVVTLPD